jgi:hypothetical protein
MVVIPLTDLILFGIVLIVAALTFGYEYYKVLGELHRYKGGDE